MKPTHRLSSAAAAFAFAFVLTSAIPFAAAIAASPSRVAAPVAAASDDNRVDLNTASEQELEQLPGMDEAGAKSIIANRPYASVQELKKADLSAREIVLITPLVTVKPPAKK